MTQDRDDYMLRQEMDNDLLRQRNPRYVRADLRRASPPAKPGECLLSDMHLNLHHGEKCPECGYCFSEIG